MLEFNIRNQEISRIDNFSPAEKSVEYLIAKFNFKTEDWNEAIKRAVFRNLKSKVEKDTMIEDDSCVVPWEVLVGSGDIEVSVHGVIGTKDITTDVAVFNLNRTLQGGSATQEPSPTVYAQMVEMVKDAKEVAQSVRDDADNGKFNGAKGDKGKDGKSAYQYAVEGGFKGTEQEFIDSMGKAGQVDLTGYVSKEEHEAELLKAFVKVTTDKASFHHITDSANMKVVDFGMEGITEQNTVAGNQLFDISKVTNFSDPSHMRSITNNGDGTLTIYSALTANNAYSNQKLKDFAPNLVVGETYTLNATSTGSSKFIYLISAKMSWKFGVSLEITQDMLDSVVAWYTDSDTNTPATVTISDIMINLGTTALPYEEYVGGMPSPNPDYKQPITLAGVYNEETGRYEHKCCVGNKNHWDKEYASDRNNWIKESGNFYEGMPVYVGKGNTIHLSYPPISSGITGLFVCVTKENTYNTNNKQWMYHPTSASLCVNNITVKSTNGYVYLWCLKDGLINGNFMQYIGNDLQIEISDTVTELLPHASQPFTLTSDRPLTMWDELVKRDGKWYWDYKQLKLVVDGSNSEFYDDTWRGFRIKNLLPEVMSRRDGYCTQLRVDYGNANPEDVQNHMWLGVANQHLYIIGSSFYDSELDDKGLANFKAHLNEHPLEIVTYKDESELVPLLDEEQELLHNLEMYYGVTNIYNEQGCPMWFKYCADQELHWNQKLLQIQQAII